MVGSQNFKPRRLSPVAASRATSTTTANTSAQKNANVQVANGELPAQSSSDPSGPVDAEQQSPTHHQKMTVTRFMTIVSMVFLWTSAQIPAYLWGGIPAIVYGDIGGVDRWVWFITANLLASAAVCPFVGALSDLLGRRYVALLGCLLLVAGQLVCTFAHSMNTFIAGMAVSGAGAGIGELTALAGAAEMAPMARRSAYVCPLIACLLPFGPSVLWAQLLATHAGWRSVGVLTAVYGAVALLVVAVFYHPPPRSTAPVAQTLRRVDWLGGLLSTAGCVLLVAGLLWGGYPYAWASAHVLVPLLLGVLLLAAFVAWEGWGVAACPGILPMVPRRLFVPRVLDATKREKTFLSSVFASPVSSPPTLALALVITFVSGANFFSVLMLWPSQAYNVYGHDPVGVGLRGLPFPLSLLAGCVVTLVLLTRYRGGSRILLLLSSVLMTAGCGALAAARVNNLVPTVYVLLVLAGLGVGGIVVPSSLVAAVVCPDDLMATATALALALRVAGGAVGYSIYYNVFVQHLVPSLKSALGATLARANAPPSLYQLLPRIIELTAYSQTGAISALPGIDEALWQSLVVAGQQAYAASYPYVYYASIAFGSVSILSSLLIDDIGPYMDDHVAVVIA